MARKKKIESLAAVASASKDLNDALFDGTDLACALLAGSHVEKTLASFLDRFFVEGETSAKILSFEEGSLGTASSRADMAYVLGLIDQPLLANVKKIAEIRNTFAHHHLA